MLNIGDCLLIKDRGITYSDSDEYIIIDGIDIKNTVYSCTVYFRSNFIKHKFESEKRIKSFIFLNKGIELGLIKKVDANSVLAEIGKELLLHG